MQDERDDTGITVGTNEQRTNNEDQPTDEHRVPSYGLLHITRAYNRKEITFDEWLRQSREWAEQMIRQSRRAE